MPDKRAGDGGAAQVQSQMDADMEKGYRGTVPDPTPNHNYTVAGNDEPTPETDPKMRAEAAARRAYLEQGGGTEVITDDDADGN